MNLSKKTRALIETAIEAVFGLAAATPLLLTSSGVNSKVGAGAAVLAVSVGVTNLMQVPAVERLLDRMLGTSSNAQPFTDLAQELHDVEAVLGEHVASHVTSSSGPSSAVAAPVAASAPEAPVAPEASSPVAIPGSADGGTPPAVQ